MSHEFIILKNGELKTYTNYEDIPCTFDRIIKFLPEVPLPPHTHEQHEEIHEWQNRFKRLMEIEKQNGPTSSTSNTVSQL
jgi:hypothetical protein